MTRDRDCAVHRLKSCGGSSYRHRRRHAPRLGRGLKSQVGIADSISSVRRNGTSRRAPHRACGLKCGNGARRYGAKGQSRPYAACVLQSKSRPVSGYNLHLAPCFAPSPSGMTFWALRGAFSGNFLPRKNLSKRQPPKGSHTNRRGSV